MTILSLVCAVGIMLPVTIFNYCVPVIIAELFVLVLTVYLIYTLIPQLTAPKRMVVYQYSMCKKFKPAVLITFIFSFISLALIVGYTIYLKISLAASDILCIVFAALNALFALTLLISVSTRRIEVIPNDYDIPEGAIPLN